MACIGVYTPSKHEMVGETTYRNLAICLFPVAHRIPLEEGAGAVTDEDRTIYGVYGLFLMHYANQNKARRHISSPHVCGKFEVFGTHGWDCHKDMTGRREGHSRICGVSSLYGC